MLKFHDSFLKKNNNNKKNSVYEEYIIHLHLVLLRFNMV